MWQAKIIRWLLNHDPGLRPTSAELLQSELLPPPQLQEAELNEVLRSTISNPDSKSYRNMVSAMFSQNPVPAKDFVYDNDFYKVRGQGHVIVRSVIVVICDIVFLLLYCEGVICPMGLFEDLLSCFIK